MLNLPPKIQTAVVAHDYVSGAEASPELLDAVLAEVLPPVVDKGDFAERVAAETAQADAEVRRSELVAKLAEPKPGDDCPTQRIIDLQARHAIKEWDGGL